jgi:hypothetical protein
MKKRFHIRSSNSKTISGKMNNKEINSKQKYKRPKQKYYNRQSKHV